MYKTLHMQGLIYFSIPSTAESARLRLNVHFSNTAFFLLM
jgi:hypothetical protein